MVKRRLRLCVLGAEVSGGGGGGAGIGGRGSERGRSTHVHLTNCTWAAPARNYSVFRVRDPPFPTPPFARKSPRLGYRTPQTQSLTLGWGLSHRRFRFLLSSLSLFFFFFSFYLRQTSPVNPTSFSVPFDRFTFYVRLKLDFLRVAFPFNAHSQ